MEVGGGTHVPAHGPAVLVANHESIWDPFILGVLTERPIRYMAKAELWRWPPVGRVMDALGTFPVDRGRGDVGAMSSALRLLEQGELLGVFPQGTSKLSAPRRYQRGAARLALESGAPLIPVRLTGTRGILKPGLPRVTIEALPPIQVERGRATIAASRALTAQLEEAIAA